MWIAELTNGVQQSPQHNAQPRSLHTQNRSGKEKQAVASEYAKTQNVFISVRHRHGSDLTP
jgi:hypothetical protein